MNDELAKSPMKASDEGVLDENLMPTATVTAPEKYGGGSIAISDYNSAWPEMFEQERASVHAALGDLVLRADPQRC